MKRLCALLLVFCLLAIVNDEVGVAKKDLIQLNSILSQSIRVAVEPRIMCNKTGEAVKCFKCDTEDGNCMEGVCEDRYCFKRTAMLSGRERTSKGCLSAAPQTGCVNAQLWGVQGVNCVCEEGRCNSASTSTLGFILGALTLIPFWLQL